VGLEPAIPAGSKKVDAAEKFIAWATSKEYAQLVASKEGWANVPSGDAHLAYQNPNIRRPRRSRR
jgi:sorbitol/mannitol transport system substrate-binding protein